MSAEQFELAFYGELSEGTDLEECKAKLAQLFKANAQQIERMFSGGRVVLKSKLDKATGDKYLAALRARGAECKLELVNQAPSASAKPSTEKDLGQSSDPQPKQEKINQSIEPAAAEPSRDDVASKTGIGVAGEKVDELLSSSSLTLDPVGVDLGEKREEEPFPELPELGELSLAPVGSDMGQEKKEQPVDLPDISHLSIDEK